MSPPRILFTTTYHFTRETGGAEIKMWMLATELVRRGWDVHFASEMNEVPEPGVMDGVVLHGLPEKPRSYATKSLAVRELMERVQPDVVYNRVFNSYTYYSVKHAPAGALTIWAMAAPIDGPLWSFLFERVWKTPLRGIRRFVPLLRERWRAVQGMRSAKLVLTQFGEQQEHLRKLGVESEIMPNCHESVPESAVQIHEGTPEILWVGSVKALKRPEIFLDLARRCRDLKAKFVLVGKLYDQEYAPLIADAEKLPNFEFVGFVPRSEIGKYFTRAHLHMKTSRFEALPDTFIQAWMHGAPVISLDVDPDRLLRDQGLGTYATDVDELERQTRELISDRERRMEIGRRAREFAVREYDLVRNVDRLEELFRKYGVEPPTR